MEGKVTLDHFPKPPQKLNHLWLGEGEETEVFLKYARVLNNAVYLSSVAQVGVPACFSQLYVLDSHMEITMRKHNKIMPKLFLKRSCKY